MDKKLAFEEIKNLSFIRVCGTEDELKAAKYLVEECENMGIEAHIEPFEIPNPTVHTVALEMTKPYHQTFYCTGQGFSGNTPDQGIEAPLVYIHNGEDEYIQDVKGKIVLSTGGMRGDLRMKLVEKGAVGYIVTWGGIYDSESMINEVPHRWARLYSEDTSNFPGVMMNKNTAEKLLNCQPELVKLVLKQDPTTVAESRNVVATIEGTDKKDEVVVFSAHYDSVEFSQGAWDNATGSITILELARYFKEHKPSRTLKFVWCGSEEIGLKGSWAYCEAHKDELKNIILDINFDMTGVTFGETHVFGSLDKSIVDRCVYLAKSQGIHIAGKVGLASTDSTSFAIHEVPAITFGTFGGRGGAEIHSNRDTMDRLSPDAFIELAEFAALFASEIVNAKVNVIPRALPKEVTDGFELNKKTHGWS